MTPEVHALLEVAELARAGNTGLIEGGLAIGAPLVTVGSSNAESVGVHDVLIHPRLRGELELVGP